MTGKQVSTFGGALIDAIQADRAPLATDNTYKSGQTWVDNVAKKWYVCVGVVAGVATWTSGGSGGGGTGTFASLTNPGVGIACTWEALYATKLHSVGHSLGVGYVVQFDGTAWAGIVSALTDYYVVWVDADNFEVSATVGGTPLQFDSLDSCDYYWMVGTACTMQAAGDTVTKTGHGLLDTQPLQVASFGTGVLPPELAPLTVYYVINKTDDTFQLEAVLGSGTPIDFSVDGGGLYFPMTGVVADIATLSQPWVHKVGNALAVDTIIQFDGSGTLPPEFTAFTDYYVVTTGTDDFQVSATLSGTPIEASTVGGTKYGFANLITTAIMTANDGVVITNTSAPAFSQILQTPIVPNKSFFVVNSEASTNNETITYGTNTIIIEPSQGQQFFWDGAAWDILTSIDASDVTFIPFTGITSTNVQDAVKEVADERVPYTGATTNVNIGANTIEAQDTLITGLGVDAWWNNTVKSVNSFITNMSTYIKTMLGDGTMATGIPNAEWPKFSITVADTTMDISINLNGVYTSWNYYIKGQKFTQTGALTKTGLTPAAGFWFVYISSANVFTVSQLPWSISGGDVMLFSFIWDSAAATPTADNTISDERHNMGRDVFNHASEHAVGAKWESGMLPVLMNGIAQDQTTLNALNESYLRAQLQVTNGVFWDEDLKIAISHAGAPAYDWNFNFKQFLGFSEAAVATTNATQITFTTTRTVVAGQRFTCMSGSSTTTVRGSGTFTVGGTGTVFATSSVTNMAAGDTIVVGAKIPIWYRATNGGTAFGDWRKIAATDVPVAFNGTVARYNTVAGLTDIPANGRYFNMWIIATNNTAEPVIAIMGQTVSTNTNLGTFLASALSDISSLSLGSLPWAEFCPLMRLTYEYDSGFNASYRVRLRDVTNLRLRVSTINFGNITSGNHTALSNRSDANSHPASAVSFDVGVTGISQGDIQAVLDYYFAPQRPLTSAGTITSADNVVVFNGGAAITQALPACSTMSKKPITFKNISATNSVTFTPDGTDLMDETILLPLSTFTFLGVYNTTDSLWHWTL